MIQFELLPLGVGVAAAAAAPPTDPEDGHNEGEEREAAAEDGPCHGLRGEAAGRADVNVDSVLLQAVLIFQMEHILTAVIGGRLGDDQGGNKAVRAAAGGRNGPADGEAVVGRARLQDNLLAGSAVDMPDLARGRVRAELHPHLARLAPSQQEGLG